jgi:hypothetical protein
MIKNTRFHRTARVLVAAIALGGLGVVGPATQPADAVGLRNCVDITGSQLNRVGCYENVWANGREYRMTFSNLTFKGETPSQLDRFYVMAPQTAAPQGPVPSFPHDHTIRDVPAANSGSYSVKLAGFFVLCTGQGIVSGDCVPLWTSPGGPALPFAQTVVGGPLTSTEAIEAAAEAGNVALVDLGPGAMVLGSVSPAH